MSRPILIVGQAPLWLKEMTPEASWLADFLSTDGSDPEVAAITNTMLIETGGEGVVFEETFGKGWLRNGVFSFTTAIRCRLWKESSASAEMIENCATHTRTLITEKGVKGVITIGKIAKAQVEKIIGAAIFDMQVSYSNGLYTCALPHNARWESGGSSERKKLVSEMLRKTTRVQFDKGGKR